MQLKTNELRTTQQENRFHFTGVLKNCNIVPHTFLQHRLGLCLQAAVNGAK